MLPPQSITRHQPTITLPTEAPARPVSDSSPLIRAHLTPTLYALHRNPWAWVLAILLHLLVVAAVLFIHFRPQPQMVFQNPPGVDITFEGAGSGQQTTVPAKTLKGPTQEAQTASALPPPPPPPSTTVAPKNESQTPAAQRTPLPAPPPVPQQQETHLHASSHAQAQKYVFLDGMSYGNSTAAARPAPRASRGMNFSPPLSDSQAATASDFSVKGDAGSGWSAALEKWVQEHAYYPQAAIEQDQQGTATVEFTVDRAGHVSGVRLLDSSGSPFLDQAWFQLFADNTLPPFPPDAKSNHIVVRYTVHYHLVP